MSTNNHTAITNGAAANAATVNTPLGTLDAAIGDLTGLTTTPKTSVAGAIGATALGTTATTISGAIAELNTDIGAPSAMATKTTTSVALGVKDAALANRAGTSYEARGGMLWDPILETLTLKNSWYIFHGISGKYVSFQADYTIDFSTFAGSTMVVAYVAGVDVTTIQSNYSTANIKVEAWSALTNNLYNPDIIVIATYATQGGKLWTPFADTWADRPEDAIYECRGGIDWNPTTKILTLSPNTYIMHGLNGKYLMFNQAITLDFSAGLAATYAYVVGVTRNAIQTNYSLANVKVEGFAALTRNLYDPDIYVLAVHTNQDNSVVSPFINTRMYRDYLAYGMNASQSAAWENFYPNLSTKLAPALVKMMAPVDDFKIVLWGDSILARENHTSAGAIDPTALPPGLITRNIAWYLWDRLPMRKGFYRRYDYTGAYFTETGTWATSTTGDNTANGGPDTAWDDELDRPTHTRISDATTAAFAWTLGVTDDESGCNLIYRTDTNGDAAATIAVTEGNGYLEYWTGAAWAEANGATFSMLEADEGARRGNTIYNKRLKLRKATAHESDSVTVTVSKATADADRLLYWGVELYDEINGKFIPQLVNSARGSHTLNTGGSNIYDYMDDDLLDQAPDLVVFEIPLLNMIAEGGATKTSLLNSVQDVIWGDRGGATNTWNLKTISNDWSDFQVLIVIPHHTQTHYIITTNVYVEPIADLDYLEIYNAVKALIIGKADVAMIDMATAFEREIDASIYAGDYYTALDGSGATGATYMSDESVPGVHPNDNGTLVYARHICPVLAAASF